MKKVSLRVFSGVLLSFLGGLVVSLPAAAYPSALKFDVFLTATPDQLDLLPGDRFVLQRSASGGLLRLMDSLGFSASTTISPGGNPQGGCLNGAGTTYYTTLGNGDLVTLDLSDPLHLPSPTTATVVSGATFTKVRCWTQNNKDYVYLWDTANRRITVYNASDQTLIKGDASSSSIALDDQVVDFRVPAAVNLLLVFKSGGTVQAFDPLALYSAAAALDLTAVFPHANQVVAGYTAATTSLGYIAAVINNSDPGEMYLLDISNVLSSGLLPINADTTAAGTHPVLLTAFPAAVGFGKVINPIGGAGEADYAAVVSQNGTLEWLDFADRTSSGKIAPKASLATAVSAPADGVLFSSKSDGYLYLADRAATRLRVLTENPAIAITSAPQPASFSAAQEVTFAFQSDLSGAYNVQLNGYTAKSPAIISGEGTQVQKGQAAAHIPVTVTVPANTVWVEGVNTLTIFVESGGRVGRNRVSVEYIPPPKPVEHFSLAFGNQKIFVRWRSLASDFTDHYNLYVGGSPAELATAAPIQVTHPGANRSLQYILQPLANGTEVFVQISAVNQRGMEGPRSEIKSEIPEETVGLLERFHEEGGCGTAGGPSLAFGLCAAAAALWLRRRRGAVLMAAALLGWGGLAEAASATASPREFSTDVYYSFWIPHNRNTDAFFGGWGNSLVTARFGWFPVADLNLGLESGFLYKSEPMRGAVSNRPAGEAIDLFYVPILYSVQYRLHALPPPFLTSALEVAFGSHYYSIEQSNGRKRGLKYTLRPAATLYLNLSGLSREIDQLDELYGINRFLFSLRLAYQHQFSQGVDLSAFEFGLGFGAEF